MKLSLNKIGKMCPENAPDCTDFNLDFKIFRGSMLPDPPKEARRFAPRDRRFAPKVAPPGLNIFLRHCYQCCRAVNTDIRMSSASLPYLQRSVLPRGVVHFEQITKFTSDICLPFKHLIIHYSEHYRRS